MNLSKRPLVRALLLSACSLTLIVSGCNKKPVTKNTGTYTPPSTAKPTASISADKTSINPGIPCGSPGRRPTRRTFRSTLKWAP